MLVDKLKELAEKNNLTQAEIAKLTGLSKSIISEYFSGKKKPRTSSLLKLASVLKTTVEELDESRKGNITVAQAAKLMGCDPQFVRIGLQQGSLPIGAAVKVGETRYSYYISPKLFYEFTGIRI